MAEHTLLSRAEQIAELDRRVQRAEEHIEVCENNLRFYRAERQQAVEERARLRVEARRDD